MTTQDLGNGVTKVILTGRIDIAGANEIDLPLQVVAGSRRAVIMDLQAVSFMASMGLRSLVLCAKAIHAKGGKVTMFGPPPQVADVITTMGVDELIPLLATEAEAVAALAT
jgi:anti-sigma B factor antagonist